MTKAVAIAFAVCVLALAAGFAHCNEEEVFNVEGKVYCDTCRVLFETKISQFLHGAEVKLTCKNPESGMETFQVSGKTDKDGRYNLVVEGDHENEICDVTAVSSPDSDCNETPEEINSSRVVLTTNSGMESSSRYANPIGFQKKEAHPNCAEVLEELRSTQE